MIISQELQVKNTQMSSTCQIVPAVDTNSQLFCINSKQTIMASTPLFSKAKDTLMLDDNTAQQAVTLRE
jgi:hypothetical protein